VAVFNWRNTERITPAKPYTCAHCGIAVASDNAYGRGELQLKQTPIVICPMCGKPTYFEEDRQIPGVPFGAGVANLPNDVAGLYTEARNCMSVSAHTAACLAGRRLLMHVAVSQRRTGG
jgi:endogenous inhibitor of DNA gyrase (YacG/DUF329 family)